MRVVMLMLVMTVMSIVVIMVVISNGDGVDVGGKIQPALQGESQLHCCLVVRHVGGDLLVLAQDECWKGRQCDVYNYFFSLG